MPTIPKQNTYAPKKKPQERRITDNSAVYNSPRWRKKRLIELRAEPLCRQCMSEGRVVAATVRDHITPITQGGDVWDTRNIQSLCKRCHDRKSGREAHDRPGGGIKP